MLAAQAAGELHGVRLPDTAVEARSLVAGGEDWVTIAQRSAQEHPGATTTSPCRSPTARSPTISSVQYSRCPSAGSASPSRRRTGSSSSGSTTSPWNGRSRWTDPPGKVIESVRKQREALARHDFLEQVFEEYNVHINEEALQRCLRRHSRGPPADPALPRPGGARSAAHRQHVARPVLLALRTRSGRWRAMRSSSTDLDLRARAPRGPAARPAPHDQGDGDPRNHGPAAAAIAATTEDGVSGGRVPDPARAGMVTRLNEELVPAR